MMRKVMKAGLVTGLSAVLAAGVLAPGAMAGRLPSDRSMRIVANYAWANMPAKYTSPSGIVVITDKSKRKAVMVADDILKFVIQRGVYSGRAQNCELFEDQTNNLRALRRVLKKKYKHTRQQSLYLHFLHLTAVQFMSGQFKIVGTDENNRKLVLKEIGPKAGVKCTDAQKQAIKDDIDRFVAASPPPPKTASTKPLVQPVSEPTAPK